MAQSKEDQLACLGRSRRKVSHAAYKTSAQTILRTNSPCIVSVYPYAILNPPSLLTIWVEIAEKVGYNAITRFVPCTTPPDPTQLTMPCCLGGKAKPLKAPKKEKKELDDEELAFRDKQKAGMLIRKPIR